MPNLKILLPLLFCLSAYFLAAQLPQGFMFPNGFPLKKGQAYYQNGDFAFNHFYIGATDNLSFGLGTIPTFVIDNEIWMYTISAKIAVTSLTKKISVGLGFFHWGVHEYGDWQNAMFVPYGVATFGSPKRNVSILGGAFYGFGDLASIYRPQNFEQDEDFNAYPNPMFGFSVHQKGTKRGAFLFESYYFKDCCDHILITAFGARIYGREAAFDLSLPFIFYAVGDDPDIFPIPWLGLHVGLGKKSRALFQK